MSESFELQGVSSTETSKIVVVKGDSGVYGTFGDIVHENGQLKHMNPRYTEEV